MALEKLGVVLLPDFETDRFVRALSHELPGNTLLLGTFDTPNEPAPPHPHVSLYHFMAFPEDRGRLWDALKLECAGLALAEQRCNQFRINGSGWCFLETPKTDGLLIAQMCALNACGGLRHESVPISWAKSFTADQQSMHAKWGDPNVGKGWEPHFTFGRLQTSAARVWPSDRQWSAYKIALVRLGDSGTVVEIINEFVLPVGSSL